MAFVSWQQYIYILVIVTILYYLFVWIFYFRFALPSLKNVRQLFYRSTYAEDGPDEITSVAQHVLDELRPLFVAGIDRDELFIALRNVLKKYNEWNDAGFRSIINEFIIHECQVKCAINPGEKDMNGLWLG
jgi:hypothetical protein